MEKSFLRCYCIDEKLFIKEVLTMLYLVTIMVSLLGATIQGITGFGASLVIMATLPYFTTLPQAVALSGVIPMVQMAVLVWLHKKDINWRRVVIPTVFYLVGCWLTIKYTLSFDPRLLKGWFGVFLIILAIYFLGFSEKAQVKDTIPVMVACSFASGLCNGLFGIGGPLMVLYYLAACDSMDEYVGNIQCLFLITDIYCLATRAKEGIFTADMIGPAAVGIVAILIGQVIASKLLSKINSEDVIRKCSYMMVGVSGVLMAATNLL